MSGEAEKSEPMMPISEAISLIESVLPSPLVQRSWSSGPRRMYQDLRSIVFTLKLRNTQQEYYYKGVYPVEIIRAFRSAGHRELEVRARSRFLHTSNYSNEMRWVNPGEALTVPARQVWRWRRNTPQGHL